ncbi:MAG: outer membrane protein assembly factor BamE [Lysobacteraceae bacterium]|nr:MAG: outer membrane protein assembly factor BamE [Xanthomonadaceae bacterium]
MRKLLPILLALQLSAIVFASGCGVLYRQPIYQGNLVDKTAVDQLQQGMDKRQVMTLLGTPSVRDPFHHDRWDYVASRRTGRSGPTEVKNMTLYFENEALAKWEGEYFPEEDAELSKTMAKFGNLTKDKKKKGGR